MISCEFGRFTCTLKPSLQSRLGSFGNIIMHAGATRVGKKKHLKKKPFILGDCISTVVGFFGQHMEKYASEQYSCLKRFKNGEVGYSANVTFSDLLVFCRRVCEREQAYQRILFKSKSEAEGDLLEVTRLNDALRLFGFNLRRAVVQELVKEVCGDGSSHIHFSEFRSLMALLRERDGFLAEELGEFEAIFDKFKLNVDGVDSLSVGHLENIMRGLGFKVSTNRLQEMLLGVDDDNSGTLDYQEFVRLMQMHFQDEEKKISGIFNQMAINERLGPSNIWNAIEMVVGEDIDDDMREQAWSVAPKKVYDFQDFRTLAERVRRMLMDMQQAQAGFTNAEMVTLRELFNRYDRDGSGGIDGAEAQSLITDFGIKCESKEDQKRLAGLFDSARTSAREALIIRNAAVDSPKVGSKKIDLTFLEIVNLVRIVKNEHSESAEQQRQRFVKELGFSLEEGVQFLRIFLMWSRKGSAVPVRNVKMVLLGTTDSSMLLSHQLFVSLVLSLEVTMSPQEKDILLEKLKSVGNGEGLDFEGFLVMMRWLLDKDFCGVQRATANKAQSEHERLEQQETDIKSLASLPKAKPLAVSDAVAAVSDT